MHKKGLSNLIVTVLIVLVVIASVAIFWAFIRPQILDTGGDIKTGTTCLNVAVEPKSCKLVSSNLAEVIVQVVKGEANGFVAVLEFNDQTTNVTQITTPLGIFETRKVTFSIPAGKTAVKAKVIPVINYSDGNAQVCDAIPREIACTQQIACTADADCNDELVCNGIERCAGGFCVAGTPAADRTVCNVGRCESGVCVAPPSSFALFVLTGCLTPFSSESYPCTNYPGYHSGFYSVSGSGTPSIGMYVYNNASASSSKKCLAISDVDVSSTRIDVSWYPPSTTNLTNHPSSIRVYSNLQNCLRMCSIFDGGTNCI